MRISRKIWGGLVFAIGMLWFVGGIFGYFQGHFSALVFIFCGSVLLRMGYNLVRGEKRS